jgi:hypothetical protein
MRSMYSELRLMDAMKIFCGGSLEYVSGVVRIGSGIVVEIMSASKRIRIIEARNKGRGRR